MQRAAQLTCRPLRRSLTVLAAVVALLSCASPLSAQDKKPKSPAPEPPPLFANEFWQQRGAAAYFGAGFGAIGPLRQVILLDLGGQRRFWEFQTPLLRGEARTPAGAAAVVLSTFSATAPLSELTFLQHGDFSDCWSLIDALRVRTLDPQVLGGVRDDLPLPDEQKPSPEAVQESFALNDALLKALRSPVDQFEKVALASLSADSVSAKPQRFRGLVVRLDGRLRRVVRKKAPPLLEQYGIRHLYEVWILSYADGAPRQACLLTPSLPPGIKVGDVKGKGPPVVIAGYFFKKYRFPEGAGLKGFPGRTAPLLVGHLFPIIVYEMRAGLAAGSILAAGFSGAPPLEQLDYLVAGARTECWEIRNPMLVPRLSRDLLDAVKDERPLPSGFEDSEEKTREAGAYFEAVVQADRTPAEAFLKVARKQVTLALLFNEPWRYRGDVVQVSGRLRRVIEMPPPQTVAELGVKHLYEVWLINDKFGYPNPAVLLCTQLPRGISVTEEVRGRVPVTFVGYFFKKYRYRSGDDPNPKKPSYRDAPMLIGRLVLLRPEKREQPAWAGWLLPVFFTVIMVTFSLVFLLSWYFRRTDRRVQSRVDAAATLFVNAPEPEPEASRERQRPEGEATQLAERVDHTKNDSPPEAIETKILGNRGDQTTT